MTARVGRAPAETMGGFAKMMSAKLSAGSCLEGTLPITIDFGPQARLLDRFGQQVHAAAKDFRNPTFQRSQPKQVHAGGRIKLGGEVDVTSRLGVTTGNGAEQGEMADAGTAQLGFVRPQSADDVRSQVGRGRCAHRGALLQAKE